MSTLPGKRNIPIRLFSLVIVLIKRFADLLYMFFGDRNRQLTELSNSN
jgi:hypothetical protein